MVIFRRRRAAEAAGDTEASGDTGAADVAQDAVVEPEAQEAAGAAGGAGAGADGRDGVDRSRGPWDVTEVDDDVVRVDLGALRVPAVPGMELRLEVEDGTGRVVAATVGLAGSGAQVQVFAAPRTTGIWDDVRTEIADSVVRSGGSAETGAGTFGTELLARVPTRTPDGRTAHAPARFVGVDGPRWFLRAVLSGPAAVEPGAAAPLEALLRGCVVVRGAEAMAPRDLLALRLPPQPGGQPAAAPAAPAATPAATPGAPAEGGAAPG